MKLSLTQQNLNKALATVSRVVGTHTSLPVLSNVLLQTDKKRLKLTSTNLEIGINYWVGAKVDEDGKITVPARLFNEYVASLPKDTIKLDLDKQNLHIKTTNYQSTINGVAADEFPSIPRVEKGASFSVPTKELREALTQVVLAASFDDARPVLNGVYFYTDKNNLVIVATDSYRLAERKITFDTKTLKQQVTMIVPARTIQELVKMLDDTTEEVSISSEENQVLFKFGDIELVSRLIDGQFPDYRQLIPNQSESTVMLSTAEFISIVKVASLFARENAGSITLKVDAKTNNLSIRSVASQVGENVSKTKVEVEGGDTEVTLNGRYLLDGLAVVNQENVSFAITGKVNPCLLRPQGSKDYLHVIMPLRS